MSFLQQKALVAITFSTICWTCWPPPSKPLECNWLHAFFMEREVDNLQEICESDANVSFLLVNTLDAISVVGENVQHVTIYY